MRSGTERTKSLVELLDKHAVDIAGLQEFQAPQARAFHRMAGNLYSIYSPPESTENSSIWRTDRWTLALSGIFTIPHFNGHTRHMPIIALRERRTRRSIGTRDALLRRLLGKLRTDGLATSLATSSQRKHYVGRRFTAAGGDAGGFSSDRLD